MATLVKVSAVEKTVQDRFVANLLRPYTGEPSRHLVGLPPMEAGGTDTRERMAFPRVLVLESRPEGTFLNRYDDSGGEVGYTWHQSIDDAKEQAVAEYGKNLGPWIKMPDSEQDPVGLGMRLAKSD
jgi:hypothetical protein